MKNCCFLLICPVVVNQFPIGKIWHFMAGIFFEVEARYHTVVNLFLGTILVLPLARFRCKIWAKIMAFLDKNCALQEPWSCEVVGNQFSQGDPGLRWERSGFSPCWFDLSWPVSHPSLSTRKGVTVSCKSKVPLLFFKAVLVIWPIWA